MKSSSIKLIGVSTHNLKKINVEIFKNKITTIYGRSGAGKSSLAYDSLYKLCSDEFSALENGYTENSDYLIEDYSGIIPSVAISQKNTNKNPRSTLYSYLNIPYLLSYISKYYLEQIPRYEYLKLNKIENECPYCKGLGEKNVLNKNTIVDIEKSIEEKAFLLWSTGSFSDLYNQLLLAYCAKNNIPTNISFKNLDEKYQKILLYTQSDEKISVKFKYKNIYRTRKLSYEGAIIYANKFILENQNSRLITKEICKDCFGSRINLKKYEKIKIFGIKFSDFLNISIDSILNKLNSIPNIDNLLKILKTMSELGLGYLNLSRSVPSLSGGELQKIKFSRLLNSNISGVLLVIDEISSQLNPTDFPKILKYIQQLSDDNTVVLIEHSEFFIKNSDYALHIGPYPGVLGGYICENTKIIPINNKILPKITDKFINFVKINKNNVINQSVKIPENCLTVFMGPSGSGKSSIAKSIEETIDTIYISQKTSNFNYKSVLASTLKVNNLIAEIFSKSTNCDEKYFNLSQTAGCPECLGTGVIKYDRGYDNDIYVTCNVCDGKLFDPQNDNLKKTFKNLTIIEFYSLEISELIKYIYGEKKSLINIFETMISLGLGHLSLNRKTQTLSGGELHRIKLCENLSRVKKTDKILIIDEPIAGLDPETATKVAHFIYTKLMLFKALILIEHRTEILNYADYLVLIGPGSGDQGGNIISQKFLKN